jgi:hypothetical protein
MQVEMEAHPTYATDNTPINHDVYLPPSGYNNILRLYTCENRIIRLYVAVA